MDTYIELRGPITVQNKTANQHKYIVDKQEVLTYGSIPEMFEDFTIRYNHRRWVPNNPQVPVDYMGTVVDLRE